VAVVQISKIQIRRGKKNSDSGVPQLSSAELAWAVDTQELFIGNGSVAEGAPQVGNTKILTNNDNILELASSYQFASDDPSITLSAKRPLLDKIDEIEVSVADFGAVGDGSTDNTAFFENALTQLFRNTDPDYKKVLRVPNGEFLFLGNITIPSNAIIRGETRDGSVLKLDSVSANFQTSTGLALADFTSSNRPNNIEIGNLTVLRSTGAIDLTGTANVKFDNVKFKGEYSLGGPVTSLSLEPAAVSWSNTIEGIKTTDIEFVNCQFDNNSVGIKCIQTSALTTKVDISNCKFDVGDTSIYIEGVTEQGNDWTVRDSEFNEIATQVFYSTNGFGTKIQRCAFTDCGNGTNTAATPLSSAVTFGEYQNNIVLDCISNRQQNAGVVSDESTSAIAEVANSDRTTLINRNSGLIYLTDSFRPISVFAASNNHISINYTLRLGSHTRVGKARIVIGDDMSTISLSDQYEFSDISLTSQGGKIMTGFEFKAELRDNDTDSGIETVVLFYKNPIATGALGNISYDIEYGV
jgi:hypothetical protein|tara:strand:+ start:3965 stop:5536 length:1572 start_codon:yes stop_codon:yes gene_type:complete